MSCLENCLKCIFCSLLMISLRMMLSSVHFMVILVIILQTNAIVTNITLQFINQPLNYSVINHTTPILQSIDKQNRGIECGQVIKVNDTYHLFVTELHSPSCPPGEYWCNTQLSHWIANENQLTNWTRLGTIAQGDENCTILPDISHNNVYWSPLLEYIPSDNYWYLTYVAYDTPCGNYPQNGNIYLSKLNQQGYNSILNSNFSQLGVTIMDGNGSQTWWEGQKDVVDSFSSVYYISNDTANKLGINSTMWAFYGSCCNFNATTPDSKWGVGLVYSMSNTMYGPWKRYKTNPVNFTGGVENPTVVKTSKGYYIVMFCVVLQQDYGCGFSWSLDGVNWTPTQVIAAGNVPYCRIPLGLIEQEEEDTFIFFYTDFDERHAGNINVWEGYEGLYISNLKLVVETDDS
eukprot:453951_1